ncbi:MAG: cytochrome P450 [Acidimicrobiales bacterium]|jgi:cytochrome P450|nr:cytochrome P450 [Acidimicrobiales bacterium]
MSDVAFGLNPFEPGYYDDPYRQYAQLREHDPVHRSDLGPWLITRWADVHTVLRRPGTSVDERNLPEGRRRRDRLVELDPKRADRASHAILNIDPPDHTRLRKLVSKAFTPRAVERIRARTAELTDEILDDLARRNEPVDLIADLAFPLPFQVISELLGMPEGDRDQLRAWSHTLTQVLDPLLVMEHAEAIVEASDRMVEVVTAAIAWKRQRDDDDLLSALIRAEDDGDVLSDHELIDNVTLLYLAGHETTVNLIGNGTNALLDHRDQLERLVADPTLDANAVEELLRFDSPVQFSRRIALEPFEVDGHRVEPGQMVMTGLGAANRDPAKFGPDAEQLDLSRADAREHVSFGSGVHHCLGAALARLEGQEVIGRLVRRFPQMERAADPVHNQRLVLRGYDHLPVMLHG